MRRGPLYVVLASAAFVAMMAFAKATRGHLSALEVVFWRAAVAAPLMLWFARRHLAVKNIPVLALRIALGFTTVLTLMIAVHFLAVTQVSLLHKLQPVFVAALAPIILGRGERAGGGLWLLMAVGLAGCALILAPELRIGTYWGLLPIAAAVTSAGAQLCLRVLARTDKPVTVVFYFFLVSIPLAAGLVLATTGSLPRLPQGIHWAYAVGVGVSAAVAQILITKAYALDRAALVAAASYTGPVWALCADVLFFALLPAPLELIGGSLVVISGVFLVLDRRRVPVIHDES